MVQLKEYKEGKTSFLSADVDHYTEDKKQPSASLPVFYNPRMQVNRDLSVLFLAAYTQNNFVELICEPMAGSGVRTLRYLKECGQDFNAVMCDVNPVAIDTARKNVDQNGLTARVEVKQGDAKVLLLTESREKRFDFVDVDPFGTPTPFVNAALQSLSPRGALLALTATDMPVLCGVFPHVALRKYGGLSIKAPFSHEVAVRLLIGLTYNAAGMNDQAMIPLVSLSTDHYIRVWFHVRADRTTSNLQADNIGFLYYCPNCMRSWMGSLDAVHQEEETRPCGSECTSKLRIAGPLWIGELYDQDMLSIAESLLRERDFAFQKKTHKIMDAILEEYALTKHTYIDIHEVCDLHNYPPPKNRDVIDALKEQGYRVSLTHFRPTAIRTNADIETVVSVIAELRKS